MDGLRILKENCFRCHGEDKRKGGLVLTSRELALKGGDEGKVIDLEKPEESRILKLILENADPHMPPKKQLAKEKIAGLRQWIAEGAKWDAAILESVPTLGPVTWINPSTGQPTANAVTVAPDGVTFAVAQGNRIEIRLMEEKAVKVQKVLESHMGSVGSQISDGANVRKARRRASAAPAWPPRLSRSAAK